MAPKRAAVDAEQQTAGKAPAKLKTKRKKPSPPKAPKCGCKGDCRSRKCGCGKKGEACGDSCKCAGCKNPFNILKEYNIDCVAAAQDKCLMDNIFKIEDLRGRLEQRLRTECCGRAVRLKNMLPGTITQCNCPDCGHEWQYSWCSHELVDWESRPRNHCGICHRCGDYRDAHCQKCNKCYFAGMSGFECPCQDRRPNPEGDLGSIGIFMKWAMQYLAGDDSDGLSDDSEDEDFI
ncbi:Hypp4752 [Branchiostoma lanceolatum]|uniref:Hypp4752 protein n=1 Tax=Branchiostoma lanceolatum TaxID=7740 RepID=A0A8K0ABW0_BRALA|nr:Hypp4752 [Branchiostoma lanceolatum]